jgi:hypothetical protein
MIKANDYHFVMSEDGEWIKKPGRLQFALHTKSISNSDKVAEEIVNNNSLGSYQKRKIVTSVAKFIEAYEQLNSYLHISKGNIPVAEDSIELRNKWHSYLFKGRELIDEIGTVVNICFGLKQKTSGLNEKKFISLRKIVLQAMRKKQGLEVLIQIIDENEKEIAEFIMLRNREKTNGDTLLEAPMISEEGIPSGGVLKDIDTSFVEYHQASYLSIIRFVKSIVG